MDHETRSSITPSGWAVFVIGAVAYLFGWWLGWIELMVVAGGALFALVVALLFVIGRLRFEMTRTIEPERVTVGEHSIGSLVVRNPGSSPTGPVTADDHIGAEVVPVDIPPLGPGESTETLYNLPTDRRGVVDVGPVVISKSDPLGLMKRQIEHSRRRTLWVRPKIVALPPLPTGFAKDLEGPTSDTSPKGDVAFHALREYVHGDDFRHIHWKSSARVGNLMVRQYVDNRRPHLTVVLDTSRSRCQPDEFELAVSVSASICTTAFAYSQPLSMFAGMRDVVGEHRHVSRDDVLDFHAGVQQDDETEALERLALNAVRREGSTSAVAVLTGNLPAGDVVRLATTLRRHARTIIIRCVGPEDQPVPDVAGASVVNVPDLNSLRAGWTRVLR